jgi:hypothetical protein
MWKIGIFLVGISLAQGCAVHKGYVANSVGLDSANFRYVKQGALGSATNVYVLGFGGLGRTSLVHDAKANLLQNIHREHKPMTANQALANITVNHKTSILFGPIFFMHTCTVTADIVEFTSDSPHGDNLDK